MVTLRRCFFLSLAFVSAPILAAVAALERAVDFLFRLYPGTPDLALPGQPSLRAVADAPWRGSNQSFHFQAPEAIYHQRSAARCT